MGTFAHYPETMTVPANKQEEFNERMLKILEQGGMMAAEPVSFCGRRILVIHPPAPDSVSKAAFCFNYFEDAFFDRAEFDCAASRLHTGDIGSNIFHRVVCAACLLYEFYAEKYGLVSANGEVFDASCHIGWLNHLFGEAWTNGRASDLWLLYEFLHRTSPASCANVIDMLVCSAEGAHFDTDSLLAYLYVTKSPESFRRLLAGSAAPEGSRNARLFADIDKLCEALCAVRKKSRLTDSEEVSRLLSLLSLDCENPPEHSFAKESLYAAFAACSAVLPLQITVKEIARIFHADFWTLWERIPAGACRIRKNSNASGANKKSRPIPGMDTAAFLSLSAGEACMDTASGPVLYPTDDDRAYYWRCDEKNDVHFSDEMQAWLKTLKERFSGILRDERSALPADEFLSHMADLLEETNLIYGQIYAFADMLSDYAAHAGQPEYQASIALLEQLAEENRDSQPETPPSGARLSKGRLIVKRYLAVLANPALRKEVLGF